MQAFFKSLYDFVISNPVFFGLLSFSVVAWRLFTSKPMIPTIYSWIPCKDKMYSKTFGRWVTGCVALFMLGLIIWKQFNPTMKPEESAKETARTKSSTLIPPIGVKQEPLQGFDLKLDKNSILVGNPVISPTNRVFNAQAISPMSPTMFLPLCVDQNVLEGSNSYRTTFSAIVLNAQYPFDFHFNAPTNTILPKEKNFIGSTILRAGDMEFYTVQYTLDFYTEKPAKKTDFHMELITP